MERQLDASQSMTTDYEARKVTRSTRKKTVLLMCSGHGASAAGLYSILLGMWDVRIVAHVVDADHALVAAAKHRPSHILVGVEEIDDTCQDCLVSLKQVSIESKLIICTDAHGQNMQLTLARIPIDGYLRWRHVTEDNLRRSMELAEEGIRFASSAAVDELVAVPTPSPAEESWWGPSAGRRQAILQGLAEELTQQTIADMLEINRRTEQRDEKRLERALGVAGRRSLIQRAQEITSN